MGQALLWGVLGYLSCVWDCSTSPFDPRWPSATGVFLVLLAKRETKRAPWIAALYGIVLDAVNGGAIGPHAIAGVIAVGFAAFLEFGRADDSWLRTASIASVALANWLVTPLLLTNGSTIDRWVTTTSVATKVGTTLLIVMAIHSLTRPRRPSHD